LPVSESGDDIVDLLIVGGGINGAGIARDAAGRGLKVLLVEQDDLASATSSASTKLIHGGLRYLEYYEFRLVREALIEREVLLRNAPHIIRPLTFVLPHENALRPAWMIRIGLFLYDHLGGRERLPSSRGLDLRREAAGKPLNPILAKGFSYADCWVDDARLVVLNALDARERGAHILTRTSCTGARRAGRLWDATIEDQFSRERRSVRARGLVNAAGPWVASFIDSALGLKRRQGLRLVRAAISSCAASSTGRKPTSCRMPTAVSSSPFPTSGTSRSSAPPTSPMRAIPPTCRSRQTKSTISAGSSTTTSSRRSSRPTSSGPMPACVRSMTTSPRTRRR
jgi:glycerol-3-phosphate dehydrogenase